LLWFISLCEMWSTFLMYIYYSLTVVDIHVRPCSIMERIMVFGMV
jgi:hypothetical protein